MQQGHNDENQVFFILLPLFKFLVFTVNERNEKDGLELGLGQNPNLSW